MKRYPNDLDTLEQTLYDLSIAVRNCDISKKRLCSELLYMLGELIKEEETEEENE